MSYDSVNEKFVNSGYHPGYRLQSEGLPPTVELGDYTYAYYRTIRVAGPRIASFLEVNKAFISQLLTRRIATISGELVANNPNGNPSREHVAVYVRDDLPFETVEALERKVWDTIPGLWEDPEAIRGHISSILTSLENVEPFSNILSN
jgi:hypothetical protein